MPPLPQTITGNCKIGGTNQQGVTIFLIDKNRDARNQAWTNNVIVTRSNASGNYILDLANISPNFVNGDTVSVIAFYEELSEFVNITIDTIAGTNSQNFAWTRNSGLTQGVLAVGDAASATAGLRRGIYQQTNDGLR